MICFDNYSDTYDGYLIDEEVIDETGALSQTFIDINNVEFTVITDIDGNEHDGETYHNKCYWAGEWDLDR